ncbi:MAG: Mu transposase domain-containing protein [Pseudonocardiaceae bacterium]
MPRLLDDATAPGSPGGLPDATVPYAQHCGFATGAARVRRPKDKPRVERAVQYVRGNFFAGEEFVDLADAQVRAEKWCRETAGLRIHGTIAARPAEVFAGQEAAALLPVPERYDVPIFTRVKVHRDFHLEVGKALYSAPRAYLGEHLDVRADAALVKLFSRGQLVKVHPRARPGGRVTDPEDLPGHKAGYALRDLDQLIAAARKHGPDVGIYAQRLLDDPLPWTRMRQVYRLIALARRYGDTPVSTACALSEPITAPPDRRHIPAHPVTHQPPKAVPRVRGYP